MAQTPMQHSPLKARLVALGAGILAFATLATGAASPAAAQDRALAFSLSGGAAVAPRYFGSDSLRVGPAVGFDFGGLRLGGFQLGDPDSNQYMAPGAGLRGSLRFLPERRGRNELTGLEKVSRALELGVGAHVTGEFWQAFADLRYGVVGHSAWAGEFGANAIYRDHSGLVLHAGPVVSFGSGRFNRTYFGVTPAESAASGLAAFRPSSGIYAVGLQVGAYQPLNEDWAVTGTLRYDRLRGDAGNSPIVRQGSRHQFGGSIGLMRHFNFRF